MTEVVADLLERQAFGHEVSRAGVAQRVRSLSRTANVEGPQTGCDQVVHAVGSQRAGRSLDRQEQAA